MSIILVLGFMLFLYLGAEGKWLLAFISAISAFALAVWLEYIGRRMAHAAAMKSERERKQGADDALDCLRQVQFDPDVLELSAKEAQAEKLAGALRLIDSAQRRGYSIDYVRSVAQIALRDHDKERKDG